MEGRGGPGDRGWGDWAVAAGIHLCFAPVAVWRAACAGGGLALAPNAMQQQRIEPGIQRCVAVGRVRVKHGGMVSSVDVGVRVRAGVRMVDVMNAGVPARALGAQAVGPAVGE